MNVFSLFDASGLILRPWADAGYNCFAYDIVNKDDKRDGIFYLKMDLSSSIPQVLNTKNVKFACAFPPCDHLAVSGARWFKGKGLRKLAEAIGLFANAVDFLEPLGCPYFIENPVSTISTYWRKPNYTFHPHHFTKFCPEDNYCKKTCLWTGNGFIMPEPCRTHTILRKSYIHHIPPSDDRKRLRSLTPAGFAQAVYEANK